MNIDQLLNDCREVLEKLTYRTDGKRYTDKPVDTDVTALVNSLFLRIDHMLEQIGSGRVPDSMPIFGQILPGGRIALMEDRDPINDNETLVLASHANMMIEAMRERKDDAYTERNRVVAALAKCFPSVKYKTDIEGWDPAWHGCVMLDLPTGQASWHYHDSQADLFRGIPDGIVNYDGHTTEQKYARLEKLPILWGRLSVDDMEAGEPVRDGPRTVLCTLPGGMHPSKPQREGNPHWTHLAAYGIAPTQDGRAIRVFVETDDVERLEGLGLTLYNLGASMKAKP